VASLIAITREVSDSISQCELTHVFREPIDLTRARAQHAAYERALEAAGCEIVRVDAAHDLPDAVFVEDTAIVLPEVAILARPGAPSRRPEVRAVAEALARYRQVFPIEAPSTIDGGDVLVAGRRVFIGRTSRTDGTAIVKVRAILEPIGYTVEPVRITGCLHLKSAATALADDRLLINPAWVRPDPFTGLDLVEIDPAEPFAANAVRAGGRLIYPAAFPRTRERLERLGFAVDPVDVSELAKAEGAVTCCSLIFESA
jgi:dimethylargininase